MTVADPIDTDAIRDEINHCPQWQWRAWVEDLLPEVDRLRAENAALAAALEDIAGMRPVDLGHGLTRWDADAECTSMSAACFINHPDDPDEWCPVCVAEVAWCAWKMGVLGA